jgi:hypothetical protein
MSFTHFGCIYVARSFRYFKAMCNWWLEHDHGSKFCASIRYENSRVWYLHTRCDTLCWYACELQRSELETLLAMERAARAAVEKASTNLNHSNMDSRFQTPSRTATKKCNIHKEFLDAILDNIRVQQSHHVDIVTGMPPSFLDQPGCSVMACWYAHWVAFESLKFPRSSP